MLNKSVKTVGGKYHLIFSFPIIVLHHKASNVYLNFRKGQLVSTSFNGCYATHYFIILCTTGLHGISRSLSLPDAVFNDISKFARCVFNRSSSFTLFGMMPYQIISRCRPSPIYDGYS